MRQRLRESVLPLLLALVIGMLAGLGAVVFRWLIGFETGLLWPDSPLSPAHYALIGMGAMIAGTTLAPMTAILTIFEMTYNYETILPLMTACIPAVVIVRLLHGYSIYETRLLVRGQHIVRGHDVNVLRQLKIRDVLCRDFETLSTSTPFDEVVRRMLASSFPHFVVLDEDQRLGGVLTLRDIRNQLADLDHDASDVTPPRDLIRTDVVSVREDQSLEDAFHLFARGAFSFLPVISATNPKQVVGCLKKDDLITAYNQHVLREQMPATASWICPGGGRCKTELAPRRDTGSG